jgi:hypothetical protein
MAKPIGKMTCPCCGSTNQVYTEDLGFEEFECSRCENTFTIPEDPEDFDSESLKNRQELAEFDKATHVRVMARGEDCHEFCLENMIDADNKLLEMALAGYQAAYPESTIWVEDEEMTSAGYRRSMHMALDERCPTYYDNEY